MATIVTEERVQVRFTVTDDDGTTFTDAIYVTQAERAILDDLDIASIQRQRFEAWKAAVQTSAPAAKVDQEAAARDLLAQRDAIDAQLQLVPADVLAIAMAPDVDMSPIEIGPAPILKV